MFKSKNIYLVVGLTFLIIIIVLTVLAPWIAPYGVDDMDPPHQLEDGSWSAPPFPISTKHLLGTDTNGYDILSRLLYGAKYTIGVLLSIGLLRLIIAIPLGMYMGWSEGKIARLFIQLSNIWTTIPIIIIAYLSLIHSFRIIHQVSVLVVIGIPILANTIHLHTKEIKKLNFIEGSRTLGGGSFHILRKHIFPHLKPRLVLIWIMELVQTLSIIGQLAVATIIIGGASIRWSPLGMEIKPVLHEWTGLIAISRYKLFYYPSMLLGPLIAYSLVFFSLVFIAEGLKQKGEQKEISYELE